MCFQSTFYFFALQAWLHNFKNVIWTNYLLCLQHVCYFAETLRNRIAITFLKSFSYRFLIAFCRGPDLPKMNQIASQNGASGHSKSQKIKKTEQKNDLKTHPQRRHTKNHKNIRILIDFEVFFWCVFHQNLLLFLVLQAWLCKCKNVIWTHYLLCLQHVCYFTAR